MFSQSWIPDDHLQTPIIQTNKKSDDPKWRKWFELGKLLGLRYGHFQSLDMLVSKPSTANWFLFGHFS
ncbi:hypothetical protein LINPERHAP1_LOCUS37382 [Linum perenne]